MDEIVDVAHDAIADRDWDRLRPLLHPYLHWTDDRDVTVRGRSKVLAMLAGADPPDRPAAVELRDGQIYRWTSTSAPDGG